ncbi:MAG: potassium-transporting ATPase subunit F [Hadesarchaea archaeon]|nr:potassium-transporting ATPase subunit F [Hadesarchaea archaeon]
MEVGQIGDLIYILVVIGLIGYLTYVLFNPTEF